MQTQDPDITIAPGRRERRREETSQRLLDEAVRDLKSERPPATASRTAIDIGINGMIPKQHIPSDQRRMEVYRRIATAASAAELVQVLGKAEISHALCDWRLREELEAALVKN